MEQVYASGSPKYKVHCFMFWRFVNFVCLDTLTSRFAAKIEVGFNQFYAIMFGYASAILCYYVSICVRP